MVQKKISELPLTKSINPDDIFPIVQSGVTKQIIYSDLKKPMVEEVSAGVTYYIDSKNENMESKLNDVVNKYKNLTEHKTVDSNEGYPVQIGEWYNGMPIYRAVYLKDDIKVEHARVESTSYKDGFYVENDDFKPIWIRTFLSIKVHYNDSYTMADLYPVKDLDEGFFVFTNITGVVSLKDVECLIVEYVYDWSWEK